MDSKPIPNTCCPACGYWFEAASCIDSPDATPSEGDFSACLNCGQLLVFTNDLQQRLPTEDEITESWKNAQLIKALRAIKKRGVIYEPVQPN